MGHIWKSFHRTHLHLFYHINTLGQFALIVSSQVTNSTPIPLINSSGLSFFLIIYYTLTIISMQILRLFSKTHASGNSTLVRNFNSIIVIIIHKHYRLRPKKNRVWDAKTLHRARPSIKISDNQRERERERENSIFQWIHRIESNRINQRQKQRDCTVISDDRRRRTKAERGLVRRRLLQVGAFSGLIVKSIFTLNTLKSQNLNIYIY